MNYKPAIARHRPLAVLAGMLCCFAAFFAPALHGQKDSLIALPLVEIPASFPSHTGLRAWTDDSLPVAAQATAADRLRWEHAILVRANGPGLLATPSARGAGPSRTAVVWNGLNLQSPMNGVYDLSLLPVWPGDLLEVRYGGQSAAWSTGAMAGSIQLQQAPDSGRQPGWNGMLEASGGSFGSVGGRATADYRLDNWNGSFRGAWVRAENDFPYSNTTLIGAPTQRQANNGMHRLDLQHLQEWQPGKQGTLKSAMWWQSARREIPPAMTEAASQSWQEDRAFRTQVSWQQPKNGRQQWQHQAAWLDESIAFYLNGTTDTSRSKTALWRSEYSLLPASGWLLRPGVQLIRQWARSDGYADTTQWQRMWRIAAYAALEREIRDFRLSLLLRQEWAEDLGRPFTWSLGTQGPVYKTLRFRAQISRNFNLPTFNDRFWQGLGNSALEPEKGYGADLGLIWETQLSDAALRIETGFFHLLLDNWILWQPGIDGLFRPGNLRQVWSRGWESSLNAERQYGDWRLKVRVHYEFTLATHTAVYDNQVQVLGKQLTYTPRHSGGLRAGGQRGRFEAWYLHQFTGSRFTASDNTVDLPGFSTGVLLASFRLGRHWQWSLQVDNCWNQAYQIVAFRPMPGRSWLLSGRYTFP